MSQAESTDAHFSLAEARHIVRDLFEPDAKRFWIDFLLTIAFAHAAFRTAFELNFRIPDASWWRVSMQAACIVVAVLAYYRAAIFTHELVHLPKKKHRAFRIVWNVLCGIPLLMPSFTYHTHFDHHRRNRFGTRHDGEYLPLGTQRPTAIVAYLLQPLVIPVLAVARFLILTPIAWFSPRFRRWMLAKASSMVMDPGYIRPLPTPEALRIVRIQEVLCFLWLVANVVVLSIRADRAFLYVGQAYFIAVCVLYLNALRTLAAHRYWNDGQEMTFVEQMLDSVNYPARSIWPELWAPVGTRYHALHHLFPAMPYHNLPHAHRRLAAQLPAGSLYHKTEQHSLFSALRDLWQRSSATPPAGYASPSYAGKFQITSSK